MGFKGSRAFKERSELPVRGDLAFEKTRFKAKSAEFSWIFKKLHGVKAGAAPAAERSLRADATLHATGVSSAPGGSAVRS